METAWKAGLEDVIAARSAICRVDGEAGRLYYRGYEIGDARGDPRAQVPGFGPRVYKVDDARARVLRRIETSIASPPKSCSRDSQRPALSRTCSRYGARSRRKMPVLSATTTAPGTSFGSSWRR